MKTSKDNLVLIVADSHLALDNRKNAREQIDSFIALIKNYQAKLDTLILLGDIFDFWYEWKHVIPKNAYPVLYLLNELKLKGVNIHYFAGNHDFKIQGFLENEIGMKIHMNEWKTKIDNKNYYFHHGDGMASYDVNYRKMKKVFRSEFAQKCFGGFFHPDLAMEIGRLTSESGRYSHRKNIKFNPPLEQYLVKAQSYINQGSDVVVFGHIHQQKLIELNNGWYHNPGAFLRERHYSLISGDLPTLEVWK